MEKIVINGGTPLKGEVTVSGAKNAAVAIIPAAILCTGDCRIENLPRIKDVELILDILYKMGAKVDHIDDHTVVINCDEMKSYKVPGDLARKMRGSYYLIGALLGRFSNAEVELPGGCEIGQRPIDQHKKAFEALGAKVNIEHGVVYASAEKLRGNSVYMDVTSVGATINTILAAALAEGVTVIDNPAKEPHIVDLANFLNSMGANVKGAGTDTIKITGVKKLCGTSYTIIPDQIEAGTYMVAAAASGGAVLIKNVIPKHLESISAKLLEIGAEILEFDDSVLVKSAPGMHNANVKTLPYPGFPTDMQPQIVTLLSLVKGTSIVNESVWESRYKYVDELRRMGANIQVDGRIAVVEGGSLCGAEVKACDLRAGAAMIIAGICAKGTTYISDISHIERGYEDVCRKFKDLGADIRKIVSPGITVSERAAGI